MIINRPTGSANFIPREAILFLGNATAVAIKRRWAITANHCAPPPSAVFPEVHAHPQGLDLALVRLAKPALAFIPLAPEMVSPGSLPGHGVDLAGWGIGGEGDLRDGPIPHTGAMGYRTARNNVDAFTGRYVKLRFDDLDDEGQLAKGDSGCAVIVDMTPRTHPATLRLLAVGNSVGQARANHASLGDTAYCMCVCTADVHRWVAAVTGDLDNDGDVDRADFVLIASRWNEHGFDAELFAALASRYGD